jgi:hypothetical protein
MSPLAPGTTSGVFEQEEGRAMAINRRRLIQSFALTGACNRLVEGAEPAITVEVLRNVSAVHGSNLSDDRLRVVAPVLKSRIARLQALRDFEVDDGVAPTHGILDR